MPDETLTDQLVRWTTDNLPPDGRGLPSNKQGALGPDPDARWYWWCQSAHEEYDIPKWLHRLPGEETPEWHMRTAAHRHQTVMQVLKTCFPGNTRLDRFVKLVVPLLWGTSWFRKEQFISPSQIDNVLKSMEQRV